MTDLVTVRTDGDVAVLRIDNPPVNALDRRVREALVPALARLDADPGVRAVVLACAGRTFIAGADIAELERAAWSDGVGPDLHPLLGQIEDFATPVVAAIHGTALGGGLELALACHYRVAVASATLGLPEVTLGIIPGAGGTQRLPRLVGVEKALAMGLSGKPIPATEALAAGLVDRLVDGDLLAGAIVFAREMLARGGAHPKTRNRVDRIGAAAEAKQSLEAARATALRTQPHILAARAFVDAVEAAVTLPFDEGVARERALSAETVRSEPCKALLYVLFAERAVAKVPDVTSETPARVVHRVAIVGAGTMGGGIAMACANAGIDVILTDATLRGVCEGMAAVRRNYDASVKRGQLSAAVVEQRVARIAPRLGYEGFDEADVVIEAVYENRELKRTIFAALDRIVRADAVLATNTSTLDIDAIASVTSRPERVVGLHFFSPAHVMRLLEIVRGSATAPETVATALGLAKRLGKVGVVARNLPGFIGNRMMFPYMYETQFLVEEGATPEQVDGALTRWGMSIGMFTVDDMARLNVAWRIQQEMGHSRHTAASRAKIERGTFSDEEIIERTIYALINEGARVLEDRVVLRASDIDVVYVNGYGFPRWRGGPMFYADQVGLSAIHKRIVAFRRKHGVRWKPAPLLTRLAKEGRTFRGLDAERALSAAD